MDFATSSPRTAGPQLASRTPSDRRPDPLARPRLVHHAIALVGLTALLGHPTPARAVDGCLVLLCLAAPSWRAIAQCVPPIRSVLDDLAHGRPFPSCAMSGAGNGAGNEWASAPAFCPPQYTVTIDLESGTLYQCTYQGAVSVTVGGALWTRTWWNPLGETVTEYTDAAKTALGTWDTRFDDDLAAWLAAHPAPPDCSAC